MDYYTTYNSSSLDPKFPGLLHGYSTIYIRAKLAIVDYNPQLRKYRTP